MIEMYLLQQLPLPYEKKIIKITITGVVYYLNDTTDTIPSCSKDFLMVAYFKEDLIQSIIFSKIF